MMRGETNTESEVAEDAAAPSVERRPNLPKVPQSFQSRYKTLVPSTSDSSDSTVNQSGIQQDAEFLDVSADVTSARRLRSGQNGFNMEDGHVLPPAAQNGVSGGSASMNPFSNYYLESGEERNGTEDLGWTTSGEVHLDTIFAPPAEFKSSPLDLQQDFQTAEEGAACSEPQEDLFQIFTQNRLHDPFQTTQIKPANGRNHEISQNSPELFKTNPPQTQNVSWLSQNIFKDEAEDLFQESNLTAPARGKNPLDTSSDVSFKSPSNKDEDPFQSPHVNFYSSKPSETDLFEAFPSKTHENKETDPFSRSSLKENLDVFSPSSMSAFDPFPSPISKDLFQDFVSFNDPFSENRSQQYDPFQNVTPDIFQPLGPKVVSSDAFEVAPKNFASTTSAHFPPPPGGPSPDLFKASESPPVVQKTSSNGPPDIVFTTPHGSKRDILQPTPFSQARNLSASPDHSPPDMTHFQTFRRPPKPLPRRRPSRRQKPKPANPVEPAQTVPKTSSTAVKSLQSPVFHRNLKAPESERVEPENYGVFEDVLLTGQERCVEDWPEDSPQLDPDFRPSGKLRLRRESLKMKAESDGGSGEDQDDPRSHGKTKDRKFRVSMVPRRGSKEGKPRRSPTPGRSSKDYMTETSPGDNEDEEPSGLDYKKKPLKTKVNQLLRRASSTFSIAEGKHGSRRPPPGPKDVMMDDTFPTKSSFSAEDLDDEDLNKPIKLKQKGPAPLPRKSKKTPEASGPSEAGPSEAGPSEAVGFSHRAPPQACCGDFDEDEPTPVGKEVYVSEEEEAEPCRPKKSSKLKGLKKLKAKSKGGSHEDPPGAACDDFVSEAAKAEWLAAQKDERAMAVLEDADEDGDTDSLMEWWNTVEQWDEVPSDDEDIVLHEDESTSFTSLADKVHRGLRLFNRMFTERAEVLWQYVLKLHAIADNTSNFHHKAKIAGITGGTTTALGSVTAIAGLALIPLTFGASVIITAVGVGVATAGGLTTASASISDNVNNMHDRKKVETVLHEYEDHLLDIGNILRFVNRAMYKLRGHPFLRSGTQHYSEDWEIRRAVQMISLVDSPMMQASTITDAILASVQGAFKGMDKYFLKESRELKKGCKKEFVAQIKELANMLNDGIVELNVIREELQDATGHF